MNKSYRIPKEYSRDTGNFGHKTQNIEKNQKQTQKIKMMSNTDTTTNLDLNERR